MYGKADLRYDSFRPAARDFPQSATALMVSVCLSNGRTTINIGIFIYEGAEVLDFAGPFEVFSTASRLDKQAGINVVLISEVDQLVPARYGFTVKPNFTIDQHPKVDLLLIPGGVHTKELEKKHVINWIREQATTVPYIASVCTGAFLLAEADLLKGRTVTTHWEDIPELQDTYPDITVSEGVRWLEDGSITTSAGISAGIDMSLAIVGKHFGIDLAKRTARQMEYDWVQKADS
jgi:transcriptional regulator GlxA family with amidase domain